MSAGIMSLSVVLKCVSNVEISLCIGIVQRMLLLLLLHKLTLHLRKFPTCNIERKIDNRLNSISSQNFLSLYEKIAKKLKWFSN